MNYNETVDDRELTLNDFYQYEKECKESGYSVEESEAHDEFLSSMVDMKILFISFV
jgi:hypothetical protein